MPKRLSDTRTVTLDDAKEIFATLAAATLRREKRGAMAEVRIAGIKGKLADDNAADDAVAAEAEKRLTAFILANPDLFARPRQVSTDFGKFGLRAATDVHVRDTEETLAAVLGLGYDDCVRTTRKLDKPGIKARIDGGYHIPGCDIRTGQLATYTVAKALISDAREVD